MEIRRKVESLMPEKKNHFPILVNNFRIVARVLETKKKIKIVKLLVTKLILIKVGGGGGGGGVILPTPSGFTLTQKR